jgi:hypothetical protein
MESWRKYLIEANIESLMPIEVDFLKKLDNYGATQEVNEAPKWMRNLAMAGSLAGLGAGIGLGAGSMLDDTPKGEETAQIDKSDSITKKLVKRKGNPKAIMVGFAQQHEDAISDAPSSGNYKWINPSSFSDHEILPYVSMYVKDYRAKEEKQSISDLHKRVFGNSGLWGGKDMHVIDGSQVLPPSWSISFDVYRTKVQNKINQVLQDIDRLEDPAKIEAHFGASLEEVEAKIQRLQRTIQTQK